MIIVKLKGGLGNQLFQYAMARRVAYINNADLKLDIISGFSLIKGATIREYSLQEFNILENFALLDEITKLKKNKIQKFLEKFKPYCKRSFIKEHRFNFDPKALNLSDDVYIEGYWQSEKYFKDTENIIRREFTLKKPIINKHEDLINKRNSVSIHIRRGDYVANKKHNKLHGLCSLDYYHRAIEKFVSNISASSFFVFSDDIQWAKNNLKLKYPLIFVSDSNIKDYEELILMSKCKHNIIANSSFSWWSAWLNSNPNKIVIAPRRWFNDSSINTKDLIPKSWIRI